MQIIGSTRQKAFWNTALPDPWSTEKNKVRPSGGYGVQVLSSVHPFQGYTHLGTEMKDVYIPLLSQLHQRETNHEVGLKKNKLWFVIFPIEDIEVNTSNIIKVYQNHSTSQFCVLHDMVFPIFGQLQD